MLKIVEAMVVVGATTGTTTTEDTMLGMTEVVMYVEDTLSVIVLVIVS